MLKTENLRFWDGSTLFEVCVKPEELFGRRVILIGDMSLQLRGENHILVSYSDDSEFIFGPNDADLMNRLRNAGTDHRKFMRMIYRLSRHHCSGLYWWKEFDTYKVGTVVNSCSTMHKLRIRSLRWRISVMNIY